MIKVIVDGMTASGKSTLVNNLTRDLGLKLYQEEFRDPCNLLENFHHDKGKWGFLMQINFLFTGTWTVALCLKPHANNASKCQSETGITLSPRIKSFTLRTKRPPGIITL